LSRRLNILPIPAFLLHKPDLARQLQDIAAQIQADQFADLIDPVVRRSLERGFADAGADEGTIWLLDQIGENLVPVFNTGPDADRFVGQFKQPLSTGLISMVFASEQPFLENEVWRNEHQSKLLDSLLQVQTCAMIAVPFYFQRQCRGVISSVRLRRPGERRPEPEGFRREHLASVQQVSALLTRLIDLQLLSRAVGWGND
jgi:hypothetical protein